MSVRSLELKGISKSFGTNELFRNMDYVFKPGIYVFSGPSGCGKTTLMRMIAGLEKRDSGIITLNTQRDDNVVDLFGFSKSEVMTKPSPEIHMVHQHYKSYPWLSSLKNVLMVYKGHKVKPTDEDKQEAVEVLNRLGLGDHVKKLPSQISGGQDQRLSLASAFVNKWSSVMLYDEPTSALDDDNDLLVADLIIEHQKRYGTIEIVITHEQHVIDALSPTELYLSPEFRIRQEEVKISETV